MRKLSDARVVSKPVILCKNLVLSLLSDGAGTWRKRPVDVQTAIAVERSELRAQMTRVDYDTNGTILVAFNEGCLACF